MIEQSPNWSRRNSRIRLQSTLLGSGLLLLGLGWGLASLDGKNRHPAPDSPAPAGAPASPSSTPATTSSEEVDPQPLFRPEQMEGRWIRSGTIRREITILPGGKAKLNVQLDYLSALLYGREMNMDLSWKLKDDILTHTIVSGTPQANVDRLIRDFGDSMSFRVVKADREELILQDLDENREQHHWKAVK